jgi:hypothetical protein
LGFLPLLEGLEEGERRREKGERRKEKGERRKESIWFLPRDFFTNWSKRGKLLTGSYEWIGERRNVGVTTS